MSRLNYTPESVDAAPWLQAMLDDITLAYQEGRVDVCDRTDDEIQAQVDAIDVDGILDAIAARQKEQNQ